MQRLLSACAALMVAAMPAWAQEPRVLGEWLFPGNGTIRGAAVADQGAVGLAVAGKTGPRLVQTDMAGRVVADWTLPGSDARTQGLAAPPGAFVLLAGPADPPGFERGMMAWRVIRDGEGRPRQDWMRRFRRTALDGAGAVAALDDGGMVAAGWSGGNHAPNDGAWILRLDANGDSLWRRIAAPVTPQGRFEARAVALGPQGDVVVAVYGAPRAGDPGGVWLLRLDATGRDRNQIVVDDAPDEHPEAVAVFPDDSAAVAGWTLAVDQGQVVPAGQSRAWLARLSGRGGLAWTHSWDQAPGRLNAVAALPDGGVLVSGSLDGAALAARLDETGAVVWERGFAPRTAFTALTLLPDGSALLAGENRGQPWAVRLDY